MNKPPAFQLYPKDFLSDINVSVMNMEERGIYITLLCHCWIEGWLPNGSTKLQRICNNPLNWKESWENIKHCFYENNGKLYHKRLEEERKKQLEWREKSRRGGIKSGKSRKKTKGGSTKKEAKGNTSVCSLQSSSKYIVQIISHWNSKKIKIIEDKETDVKKKTIKKIEKRLKNYSFGEILMAINNYSTVLKDDRYFFSYKWQLWEFLERGLINFLSKNNPLENYLSDKKPKQEKVEFPRFS